MNECIDPHALPEGALLAFADGEVWPEVADHLAHCAYCREQVERYRSELTQLRAELYRASCPAPERLGLYQLRFLPAGEQLEVARHVRECPHCREELKLLVGGSEPMPLWERVRQGVGEIIEALARPVPRVQAIPLRGGPPVMQRFEAGTLAIDFSIQPGGQVGVRTLTGRVRLRSGALPAGTEIWLWQDEEAWAAPLEDEGLFSFENVVPGHYRLGLDWEGQAILLPPVEVT